MEEFVFPHLVVITKQTQVDLTALCDVFTDIFKNCDETSTCKLVGSVVFLNQVSLTNVQTALGELKRTNLGEDASGVALFVLYKCITDKSNVELDAFMFTVSSFGNVGQRRHVVLMPFPGATAHAQIRLASRQNQCFDTTSTDPAKPANA